MGDSDKKNKVTMYNKEAMRKLLEDCWDDGYTNRMMLVGKARKKAKDTYITSQLSAMSEAEGEKVGKLIARLLELKPYHMMPYNLGDMGEMGQIIDKLQKLIIPTPALPVADGEGEKVGNTMPDDVRKKIRAEKAEGLVKALEKIQRLFPHEHWTRSKEECQNCIATAALQSYSKQP